MVFIPKKNNKALNIATLLLASGVISFLISTQITIVPFVFQLAAIILLTFGIQVLQRYHLSDFKYIIDDRDDGSSYFDVIKIQGKKEVKVCSIALDRCVYFGALEGYIGKTVNSFDYKQNIYVKDNHVLIYKDFTGLVTVKLEVDDGFATQLEIRVPKNDNAK